MAEAGQPGVAASPPPDRERLRVAAREARDDAAPFALAAAAILIALGLVSKYAHWESLGHPLWWMWLIVAFPYVVLSATLLFGLNRLVRHDRRREIVIALLTLVWLFNVLGVVVLVASLLAPSAVHASGRQLLFSGGGLWLTDAVVRTRLLGAGLRRPGRPRPRNSSTQTGLPVPPGREPATRPRRLDTPPLGLLLYLADQRDCLQPTDTMPLTRQAKTLMAAESTLSAVTVLLVAARAVNILT